ncbi:hypothetical protein D6C95_09115 [Aureobasidium pullulans]|nr:hypothetical protein D6C95_09115 [Aureobasidium pullulans]
MKQHLGAQQLSRYILLLKTSGVVISCCLWDDCYLKRQSWEGDVDLHLQHDSHYQKSSINHTTTSTTTEVQSSASAKHFHTSKLFNSP